MMCDFILAATTPSSGSRKSSWGLSPVPAGPATTRFVGKSKAGNVPDRPHDGRRRGGARRPGEPRPPARRAGGRSAQNRRAIADMSLPSVMLTKDAVNRAYETTLAEGVHFERRLFHSVSPSRIKWRAWRPSWKNARPISRTAKTAPSAVDERGQRYKPRSPEHHVSRPVMANHQSAKKRIRRNHTRQVISRA